MASDRKPTWEVGLGTDGKYLALPEGSVVLSAQDAATVRALLTGARETTEDVYGDSGNWKDLRGALHDLGAALALLDSKEKPNV